MKQIKIDDFVIGDNKKFVLIAGPCVLENEAVAMEYRSISAKTHAKIENPFYL